MKKRPFSLNRHDTRFGKRIFLTALIDQVCLTSSYNSSSSNSNISLVVLISSFKVSILFISSFKSLSDLRVSSAFTLSFQKSTESVSFCSLFTSSFFLGMSKYPP